MSALDDAYDEVVADQQHAQCKTCRLLRELPPDIAASLSRMLTEKRPVRTIAAAVRRLGHDVTHQAMSNHVENRHPNVRP